MPGGGIDGGEQEAVLAADYVVLELGEEPLEFGGILIDRIRPLNVFTACVTYPTVIFVSGMLAGLFPALRIARLEPVKALRHH